MIWYFGPSRIFTGDWCFKYGFVTMEQIRQIYDEYFSGKVMTVVTDCNYSGSWVKSWMSYLEKRCIQPCQHSSRRNKTYLSFISSCGEYEKATSLFMVARAFSNDSKGKVWMQLHKHRLAPSQHLQYCITTIKTCNAEYGEPCSLPTGYSWHMKVMDESVHFIKSKMFDRWAFVIISGSDDVIDSIRHSTLEELEKFRGHVMVLDSGLGREPPVEKLTKLYQMFPMNRIRLDL